jgi:hypothetical protein
MAGCDIERRRVVGVACAQMRRNLSSACCCGEEDGEDKGDNQDLLYCSWTPRASSGCRPCLGCQTEWCALGYVFTRSSMLRTGPSTQPAQRTCQRHEGTQPAGCLHPYTLAFRDENISLEQGSACELCQIDMRAELCSALVTPLQTNQKSCTCCQLPAAGCRVSLRCCSKAFNACPLLDICHMIHMRGLLGACLPTVASLEGTLAQAPASGVASALFNRLFKHRMPGLFGAEVLPDEIVPAETTGRGFWPRWALLGARLFLALCRDHPPLE